MHAKFTKDCMRLGLPFFVLSCCLHRLMCTAVNVVAPLQEKYRSALEAASINIAELDAAAATANAAAAAAGPTTAAARSAVRRSLGGSSAHQLLGLSLPASPEPVVHGGSRRLSGQVHAGRASAAGLPPVSPKPVFKPVGSASPGFGR
jgi:hypothetical protein